MGSAVTGFVEGEDGFGIFIKAIPYNYYALFTIAAMILIVALKVDFGSMAVHEANALRETCIQLLTGHMLTQQKM